MFSVPPITIMSVPTTTLMIRMPTMPRPVSLPVIVTITTDRTTTNVTTVETIRMTPPARRRKGWRSRGMMPPLLLRRRRPAVAVLYLWWLSVLLWLRLWMWRHRSSGLETTRRGATRHHRAGTPPIVPHHVPIVAYFVLPIGTPSSTLGTRYAWRTDHALGRRRLFQLGHGIPKPIVPPNRSRFGHNGRFPLSTPVRTTICHVLKPRQFLLAAPVRTGTIHRTRSSSMGIHRTTITGDIIAPTSLVASVSVPAPVPLPFLPVSITAGIGSGPPLMTGRRVTMPS